MQVLQFPRIDIIISVTMNRHRTPGRLFFVQRFHTPIKLEMIALHS